MLAPEPDVEGKKLEWELQLTVMIAAMLATEIAPTRARCTRRADEV
jgi:hypothetical protein